MSDEDSKSDIKRGKNRTTTYSGYKSSHKTLSGENLPGTFDTFVSDFILQPIVLILCLWAIFIWPIYQIDYIRELFTTSRYWLWAVAVFVIPTVVLFDFYIIVPSLWTGRETNNESVFRLKRQKYSRADIHHFGWKYFLGLGPFFILKVTIITIVHDWLYYTVLDISPWAHEYVFRYIDPHITDVPIINSMIR